MDTPIKDVPNVDVNEYIDLWRGELENLTITQLREVLAKHDNWFSSWKKFPEARGEVRDSSKDSVIHWILSTEPMLIVGGLLDFLIKTLAEMQ